MPVRTLVGLIACNFVWSTHAALGKVLLRDFTPLQSAWLRYTSAALAFWLMALLFRLPLPRRVGGRVWLNLALAGLLSFCAGPVLQFSGLKISRALDNALIIAIEPLITVLMAWVLLGERITRGTLI